MKYWSFKILTLPSFFTSLLLLQGCSSSQNLISAHSITSNSDIISVSETHPYDENFGVLRPYHDLEEEQRILSQNEAVYTADRSAFVDDDPTLTTELKQDPDAFTLDEYVQPEPVVTYKYMHSSKFFDENELPDNKLLTSEELSNYDR